MYIGSIPNDQGPGESDNVTFEVTSKKGVAMIVLTSGYDAMGWRSRVVVESRIVKRAKKQC